MSSSFFIKSLVKGWVEKAGGKPSSFFKTFATQNQNTKTSSSPISPTSTSSSPHSVSPRTLVDLSDSQIAHLLQAGTISPHRLEADLGDPVRAVSFSSSFFFFHKYLLLQVANSNQTSPTHHIPLFNLFFIGSSSSFLHNTTAFICFRCF
jgi:hypothetical protein